MKNKMKLINLINERTGKYNEESLFHLCFRKFASLKYKAGGFKTKKSSFHIRPLELNAGFGLRNSEGQIQYTFRNDGNDATIEELYNMIR